jgi:ABC-type phosphate transport system auxiliary subunit
MSQAGMLDHVIEDVAELEDRVVAVEALAERVAELETQVAELDERTDMLRLIDEADTMDASQRSAALLQHCIRKIRASDRLSEVTINRDTAEEALHHPDVDRTTIYSDMQRCERLVGDEDICRYAKASETVSGDAELTVDLSHVDETVDASTLTNGGV